MRLTPAACVLCGNHRTSVVVTQAAGVATKRSAPGGVDSGSSVPMFDSTWLEIASLSKTIGTALAIEYFASRGAALLLIRCPTIPESATAHTIRVTGGHMAQALQWTPT